MHIFRYFGPNGFRLGIKAEDVCFDLSAIDPEFADVASWLESPDPVGVVRRAISDLAEILSLHEIEFAPPVDRQEVWASGVTYLRSKVARMGESEDGGDFYDKVYAAERPELFFKSSASRVVGHLQPVRIRRDSSWNVPEPELTLVLSSSGKIVGYAIGNDMSSRSIEGENPLYLPQAKVYDGSCALGPLILLADGSDAPKGISMMIERDGTQVFSGETSTDKIQRPLQELADHLYAEMSFPHGAFLMTGTGIVPPDEFTLRSGDVIRITIDGIGTLENPVA
jgi:2-dehydro-3-deoxy-D-arabinonate dehydratase